MIVISIVAPMRAFLILSFIVIEPFLYRLYRKYMSIVPVLLMNYGSPIDNARPGPKSLYGISLLAVFITLLSQIL